MYLIVGLGNPEKKYEDTRHNIGFDVLRGLSKKYNIPIDQRDFKGTYGTGFIGGQKVMLLAPLTYMNLSGESVRAAMDFYKIDPEEELLVIADDISLDMGAIRVRAKGSAGGHNGLKNIILHTGTQNFSRIKMGVGEKPKGWDLADYVLAHYTKAERESMDEGIGEALQAVETILVEGIDRAMNLYNKKNVQQ